MKKIKTITSYVLFVLAASILAGLAFTIPSWYIWNTIVAYKFNLPTLTLWEAFLILLMIRFIIPQTTINKTNK